MAMTSKEALVRQWVELIREWMIEPKHVAVCGLAHISDGAPFAAACLDDSDPVAAIYKPAYVVSLPQEDGTDHPTTIDECAIIKETATTLRAPNGLWVGGQKYKIVRKEEACEQGAHSFKVLICAKAGGGCIMTVTPKGMIVLSLYKDSLGQSSASARMATCELAEFLADQGY